MQQDIAALRKQRHRSFMMKGIAFAVASGICYGLYTAFTWGETQGVWDVWFAGEAWNGNAPLSAFAITFTLKLHSQQASTTCSAACGRSSCAPRTASSATCAKPSRPSPAASCCAPPLAGRSRPSPT